MDWDDGFLSVKNTRDRKTNQLIVPDWEAQIDIVEFYRSRTSRLVLKTDMKGKAPEFCMDSPKLINTFNDVVQELDATKKYRYKGGEAKSYRTLVIDSGTQLFHVWRESLLYMNNQSVLQIQDYNTLQTVLLSQFLPSLKRLDTIGAVEYIVFIDHIDHEKDNVTGAILEFPVGPSRAQGRLLAGQVDEVWLQQESAGEYIWRTRSTGLFKAKSRLDLPDPVRPATFTRLAEIVKERGGVL